MKVRMNGKLVEKGIIECGITFSEAAKKAGCDARTLDRAIRGSLVRHGIAIKICENLRLKQEEVIKFEKTTRESPGISDLREFGSFRLRSRRKGRFFPDSDEDLKDYIQTMAKSHALSELQKQEESSDLTVTACTAARKSIDDILESQGDDNPVDASGVLSLLINAYALKFARENSSTPLIFIEKIYNEAMAAVRLSLLSDKLEGITDTIEPNSAEIYSTEE